MNVIQAKNLKAIDSFSTDAYCKIQAGKYWITSKTIKGTNPSWREEFIIPIDNRTPLEDQILEVSVWDKGKRKKITFFFFFFFIFFFF